MRGGVRALNRGQSEVGFALRLRLEVAARSPSRALPPPLVDEGEAVALDASTTAYYLALELRSKRELVVVTNGLLVATAFADAPGITVLVTGGTLRLSAMSLVGDLGTDVLRTTRINKGFLGARGLSLERGLMDLNPDEVRIKQEMADACEQVYGILDGTKWHRSALLSFVAPDDLTGIVTDSSAPDEEVAAWRSRDVEVIAADPGPREPIPVRPRDLRRSVRGEDGSTSGDDGCSRSRGPEWPCRRGRLRRRDAGGARGSPFPQHARAQGDALSWDLDACSAACTTAFAAPDGTPWSTRSLSTRGRSTSACSTPTINSSPRRGTTETGAAPRRSRRSSHGCRRVSSTSAPASSCCRSTRSSSWRPWRLSMMPRSSALARCS